MNCLPSSLKENDTYAVYNQVRTVNAARFIALKEGGAVKECEMEKRVFYELLFLGLREMVYNIPQDDKIRILKYTYEAELISKAKDIGYQIIKLRKEKNSNDEPIRELLIQIGTIINDISNPLDKQFVNDDILTIFEEAKNL